MLLGVLRFVVCFVALCFVYLIMHVCCLVCVVLFGFVVICFGCLILRVA